MKHAILVLLLFYLIEARSAHRWSTLPPHTETPPPGTEPMKMEADEVMASFDVISLFISISPALAIDKIDGFPREKYDETDQQLKRAHTLELLKLRLKTFFTFNGHVYEQKLRTPMGSPSSRRIAEAALPRLEQLVLSSNIPKF
nr:unnamed protein product [Spirometra erinaceieuropaei]